MPETMGEKMRRIDEIESDLQESLSEIILLQKKSVEDYYSMLEKFRSVAARIQQLEQQNQKMKEVLEWIRDAGTDHQSILKARNILSELEEGG